MLVSNGNIEAMGIIIEKRENDRKKKDMLLMLTLCAIKYPSQGA